VRHGEPTGGVKILLLSQWFDPEPFFKGLAFAQELRRQGHEVSVLTGFPNYPGGKLYPGYSVRAWQRETMDGIPVLRVPLYPSHDGSARRRILNYLSFALAAAIGIFTMPRPDLVYVYSPPPTVALGAMLLRVFRRVPFVIDIQDMWPDTLGATGMVTEGPITRAIAWWMRLIYRRAGRIVVLSPGFRRLLIERGVPSEKIVVVPNWAHEVGDAPIAAASPRRTRGTFDILFAGNIGLAQGLDTVIEAARRLARTDPQVRFLIAGDGLDAARLRALAEREGLKAVRFLGKLPPSEMPGLFAAADALLVHLRDDPLFAVTIPSKTQAYLRAGKPILMGVRGDAAALVEEAGAGICFEPENAEALAAAVRKLIALPDEERAAMEAAGADYYRRHLSLEIGTATFTSIFEQVLAEGR
jgi:glycosyltransferase involved in cell wall biosynthesis